MYSIPILRGLKHIDGPTLGFLEPQGSEIALLGHGQQLLGGCKVLAGQEVIPPTTKFASNKEFQDVQDSKDPHMRYARVEKHSRNVAQPVAYSCYLPGDSNVGPLLLGVIICYPKKTT